MIDVQQFSIEYRKSKTKVMTVAHHKGRRQSTELIKLEVNTYG